MLLCGNKATMRDVEQTKATLLKATGQLLAKRGFRGLGISAIAAQARVGKPLIYRYFGGLQGLIAAYANSHQFWPSTEELFGTDLHTEQVMPYAQYVQGVLSRFVGALRKRPATRAVLAWGLIESNPLTKHLDQVLAQRGRAAVVQLRERVSAPSGVDVAAQNAILLAGVSFLTIRGGVTGEFAGIALKTERDWQRVTEALTQLAHAAYQPRSAP
jgi:AcrR family transcriptional regulator